MRKQVTDCNSIPAPPKNYKYLSSPHPKTCSLFPSSSSTSMTLDDFLDDFLGGHPDGISDFNNALNYAFNSPLDDFLDDTPDHASPDYDLPYTIPTSHTDDTTRRIWFAIWWTPTGTLS